MRQRLIIAALLAALPLSACAPLEFDASEQTAPAVEPSQAQKLELQHEKQIAGQQWADRVRAAYERTAQQYLSRDLQSGFAHRQFIAWGASDVGHLEVSVAQSFDEDRFGDLDSMAATLIERLDPSVQSVTITVQGQDATGYADRDVAA
ncbi:hypothetical protein [Glutamicibacter sp.]|uniref:hypothetical protein n=1 Tax=Glutamicibacter sp. TaxID=1931995 RepID=UPI0028BDDD3E|nr:hypothetical protein [Glutamicibacter sp.]